MQCSYSSEIWYPWVQTLERERETRFGSVSDGLGKWIPQLQPRGRQLVVEPNADYQKGIGRFISVGFGNSDFFFPSSRANAQHKH